jgi:hypothetical protein
MLGFSSFRKRIFYCYTPKAKQRLTEARLHVSHAMIERLNIVDRFSCAQHVRLVLGQVRVSPLVVAFVRGAQLGTILVARSSAVVGTAAPRCGRLVRRHRIVVVAVSVEFVVVVVVVVVVLRMLMVLLMMMMLMVMTATLYAKR